MAIDWKKNSDKIMAISATATAVIALAVAVLEVRNEQEFQKLSVEPYLEMGNSGGEPIGHYAFLLINNGLGPAIIKSGKFTVDGTPVTNWSQAVRMATGDDTLFTSIYSDITPNRRIKAAETIEVFKITPYSDIARSFHREMNTSRIEFEICYCSIYEDCWQSSFAKQITHEPVSQCSL